MKLDLTAASDGELAILTLAGGQAAFAEIMRRHREPIFRVVQGHVGNGHEALDILQECFVAAFVNLGKYDENRPMRAWLARIAINKARDWRRRRMVRKLFTIAGPLTADMTDSVPDDAPGIEQVLIDRDELDRLTRAVASLPQKLKEPLILGVTEGWSQAAIGDMLGISEKAVETRIRRARSALREILACS